MAALKNSGSASRQGVEKSTLLLPPKLREQFPSKLYEMLEDPRAAHSIAWLPSGRAFRILDEREFVTTTIPLYFNQTKLRSFYRQLHLWGFRRLSLGAGGKGAWEHPCFLRGQPSEMKNMRRVRVKGSKAVQRDLPRNFYAICSSISRPSSGSDCSAVLSAAPVSTVASGLAEVNFVTPTYVSKPSALPNIEVGESPYSNLLQHKALSDLHARMGRVPARSPLSISDDDIYQAALSTFSPADCEGFKSEAKAMLAEPLPVDSGVSFDAFADCIDDVLHVLQV